MIDMVKERPQSGISNHTEYEIEKLAKKRRLWEEEQKQKTPLAPGGSGEIGEYDEDASRWLGGFIYKTDSGKYFGLVGRSEYKFLRGVTFESYLKSLQKRKKEE